MGAARDDACLLLPSSLGLLEYDLLEGATFVGAAPAGGLEARPTPFARARVVLTRTESGHVARVLPGVDDVFVDDAPPAEVPLAHGARVRVGSHVAVFHAPAVTEAPPERPRATTSAPPREAVFRESVARAPRPFPVWPLALLAAGLFLAAVVRALEHVQDERRAEEVLARALPEPATLTGITWPDDVRTALELDASGRSRGDEGVSSSIDRYRAALERARDPEVAAMLRARLGELHELLATGERARMETEAQAAVTAGAFGRALEVVRAFERRFTGTAAADGVEAWRPRIQREATVALDVLLRDTAPLIVHAPRDAFVRLLDALDRFPVELAPTIAPLFERARARLHGDAPPPRRAPPAADPAPDTTAPATAPGTPAPSQEGPGTADPAVDEGLRAEEAALKTWKTAHADLLAGRYDVAATSFGRLLELHRNTTILRLHRTSIEAAERLARAGAHGAHVLLQAGAQTKKGRLVVTYEFDDLAELEDDWTTEQPFATADPVDVRFERGMVHMKLGSGLFHRFVFTDDVRIQATVVAEVARDFGLLAVDESARYRAILFNLNNTRFALKKGAAATVQPGHVLWLIGEGVWSAADADVHGFIKIAERATSRVENADRLELELVRKGATASGTLQGKRDGVHLEGAVKGDDGSGVGPARVGLFTNGGRLTVESIRLEGRIDAGWWATFLRREVELLPTPP